MHFKTIAFLGVAASLATASPVFAWGGGGGNSGSGSFSGLSNGTNITGTVGGAAVSGSCANGKCSGTYSLSATEPIAALAVGLGLVGARYLRRRRAQ